MRDLLLTSLASLPALGLGVGCGESSLASDQVSNARSTSEEMKTHALTVARHTDVAIDEQTVEKILASMSEVLQQDIGTDDLDCNVVFELAGNVETFGDGEGPSVILTQEEFDSIDDLPYDVKIVQSIEWCGCNKKSGTTILGCAAASKTMVVSRGSSNEGILWAHEFGHVAGLSHRCDEQAVLYSEIAANKTRVNATEKAAFRFGRALEGSSPSCGFDVCLWENLPDESQALLEQRLEEFVESEHVHGFAYRKAASFDERALPLLRRILKDDRRTLAWSKAALTIGAIGDGQGLGDLIEFIDRPELAEEDAERDYEARGDALIAMGFMADAGSGDALEALIERSQPRFWVEGERLNWVPEELRARRRPVFDFSVKAVAALGLTGGQRARRALEELGSGQAAFLGEDEGIRKRFLDIVSSTRRVNESVEEAGGLKGYYSE